MTQGLKGFESLTECLSVPESLPPFSEGILTGVRGESSFYFFQDRKYLHLYTVPKALLQNIPLVLLHQTILR